MKICSKDVPMFCLLFWSFLEYCGFENLIDTDIHSSPYIKITESMHRLKLTDFLLVQICVGILVDVEEPKFLVVGMLPMCGPYAFLCRMDL